MDMNKPVVYEVNNFYEDFNLIPELSLAEGKIGNVVLATAQGRPDVKRAVKVFKRHKVVDSAKVFQREVSFLQSLDHPNICRIILAARESEFLGFLCMPFYAGGDLKDIYHNLDEDEIEHIFVQTASAVAYLHRERICHFDIKKDNIFIKSSGDAVLGDLGVSQRIPDGQTTMKRLRIMGTMQVYPPEMYSRKGRHKYVHPFKVDCFSLGVLLWEMIFHLEPHPRTDYLSKIRQADLSTLYSLVFECLLQPVARSRGTLPELMILLKKESQHSQYLKDLEASN